MKVLGARVLVKEQKNENTTSSGIVIPGKEKEPTYVGTVIEVGTGALLENGQRVPMQVKKGDTVIYTTFSGSPIVNAGEEFIILNERDILCII